MATEDSRSPIQPVDDDVDALFDDLDDTADDVACDLMDLFRYQVGRRLDEMEMTQNDLADAMGIAPSTLSRLLNGDNTTLLSIAKVAKALNLAVPVVKMIPEEEMDEQIDEVKPFVRSERTNARWWPVTRRTHSHFQEKLTGLYPASTQDEPGSYEVDVLERASDDYSDLLNQSAA